MNENGFQRIGFRFYDIVVDFLAKQLTIMSGCQGRGRRARGFITDLD